MASQFVVRLKSTKPSEIRRMEAILRNPVPILRQIGQALLAQALKAFRDQSFDGQPWPARYPNQKPFYANVAGLVSDLIAGRNIKPQRFQNRPAGMDTKTTFRSLQYDGAIKYDVLSVEVSSNSPNAAKLQSGGISRQQITEGVKRKLAEWMKRGRRNAKRAQAGYRTVAPKDFAATKLGWLFSKKTLITKTAPRPFLGITRSMEAKIVAITGGEFVKSAEGRP